MSEFTVGALKQLLASYDDESPLAFMYRQKGKISLPPQFELIAGGSLDKELKLNHISEAVGTRTVSLTLEESDVPLL